jgi:cellulose synthase/poly-beta-1,6-N-acetylglucosamine synthase-like glycosyltransferase/succinate dehydrogenase hydrophobic anchor subunit
MGWSTKEAKYEAVKKNDDVFEFPISDVDGDHLRVRTKGGIEMVAAKPDMDDYEGAPLMMPSTFAHIDNKSRMNSFNRVRGKPGMTKHLSKKYYNRLMLHALSSALIIAALTMQITYLLYKCYIYSGHLEELWFQKPWLLLLLYCEIVYLFSSAFSTIDNLLPPSSRADLGLLDTSGKNARNCPTVDVFLPCCKEPTDVPVEAVKAAMAMDYPQDRFKVFVCDDGADDDLKVFCDAMGVESGGRVKYIRREKKKGVPHHFKCGNMNNGLKFSDAEYVVMMDADMILHPTYLRRLLPHIVSSPEVSYVQIPQAFYNLPRGDPLNDSCTMGYNRMLPHRDSLGTAFCIGTGVVFRRQHLDEIGGFQPQSITEDTMTSYVLLNKGYESVFLNETLQVGLTPWTFEGYVKQRQRWAKGAIQQLAATWKECLGPKSNLNLVQKFLYFNHTGYYFLCFNNLLLMGVLLGALAFKWKLSVGGDTDNITLIKYLALYLVLSRLSWFSLWLNMPQGVQMRNRDESHFWWIIPYFVEVCVTSLWDFKASFVFVPTSNIDSAAAAAQKTKSGKPSWIREYLSQLKFVRFHITFVAVTLSVISARIFHSFISGDCSEKFLVIGLSLFLICTCAHMMVPVTFILFPPSYKPAQRKSLIRFNADDVPVFNPEVDGVPKWSWTVLPYEILSQLTLAFWIAVLVYTIRNPSGDSFYNWCQVPQPASSPLPAP